MPTFNRFSPIGFTPDPDGPFPIDFPPEIPGRFERLPQIDLDELLPIRYGPATIKILIVVDGSIRFDSAGFALGRVITTLTNTAHPDFPAYARFQITKATRAPQNAGLSSRTDADDYDFQFNAGSLDNYDELWLFGIDQENNFINDGEAEVIANFMNDGGGVLAMGDHEDLGLGLCGKVPRVRSMRKWWFDPLPAGQLKAPDNVDLTRIDTVQPLFAGGNPNDGSESDTIPQPIWPVFRRRFFGVRLVTYPHEVLCGPRGSIRIFPDHPHEGDCVVPTDLGQPLVPGSALPEYPGGVAPEVIAHGRTVAGRTKSGYTLPSSEVFGLLGAYNGHQTGANVGRVLVDSTWHHWFNVNLNGFANSASPTVQARWDDIQAFFRNCAVWLAPPEKQTRMRKSGQLISIHIYPTLEHIHSVLTRANINNFIHLGIYARDALGRLASQCQTQRWILEPLAPIFPKFFEELLQEERLQKLSPVETTLVAHTFDTLSMAAYGGAVRNLFQQATSRKTRDVEKLMEDMDKLLQEGGKEGLEMAVKELSRGCKTVESLLK